MAKRGRPSRNPSKEDKEKVVELLASDVPVGDIAKMLRCSLPTLRKYFRAELKSGKKKPEKPLPFKVTKKHREKVALYIGCNMKPARVALAFDCTEDQLKEHFAKEIERGHAIARAKVLDKLAEQMDDGLVGATNRLEALTAAADPDAQGAQRQGGYVGKKAAANATAAAAAAGGNMFAPPKPPARLATVNGAAVKPDAGA